MNEKYDKSDHLNKSVRLIVIFGTFHKTMNRTESAIDKTDKVQLIIEAAQKRFGLYGVEKTSMREIASDLRLSKASLYYYFPDKETLYKAVVEKEQNEFLAKISEKIEAVQAPEVLLREYAVTRLSYFRTLLNLSRLRMGEYTGLKPVFRESFILFKEKEKEIIIRIFKTGIRREIFKIKNTDSTASLYLDLLRGLRISVVNDKETLVLGQEEYDRLLEKTIAFTDIFISGLKNR
jgi:AcrR family transcriptional regulator